MSDFAAVAVTVSHAEWTRPLGRKITVIFNIVAVCELTISTRDICSCRPTSSNNSNGFLQGII